MKNVKKIAALGLSATMAMGMLPATLVSADEATGTVYYLNFKPEQADQWKELAEKVHRRDWRTGRCCYSSFRNL